MKTVALYDVDSRIPNLALMKLPDNNLLAYRYNNKERIARYLRRPELLTTKLYRSAR